MTKEGTNTASVKQYTERANNIMDEQETLKEDLKELWSEADANGVDLPALKAAIKIKRRIRDKSLEERVNQYLGEIGEQLYFVV